VPPQASFQSGVLESGVAPGHHAGHGSARFLPYSSITSVVSPGWAAMVWARVCGRAPVEWSV